MTNTINTALITGGNGNLGRLTAERLLARGVKVIKFDVPGTEPEQLHENEIHENQKHENETHVIGDIRDVKLLQHTFAEHKPDTVYHLASLLSGSSEADLDAAWEINATSSFKLLQLAQKHKVNTFFFASTIASFGSNLDDPLPENAEQWPENFYGVTKVAVERLGVYYKLKHGMDFRCLRFPLVISPFAPPTAVTAYPSHAFRAAAEGKSFVFPVAKNVGMSTIFLDDVISSIINFTYADKTSLTRHAYGLHAYFVSAEMVANEILKRHAGFEYRYEPNPAVEKLLNEWPDMIDDKQARTDWGWNPEYDFEKSAARMFETFA